MWEKGGVGKEGRRALPVICPFIHSANIYYHLLHTGSLHSVSKMWTLPSRDGDSHGPNRHQRGKQLWTTPDTVARMVKVL